MSAVRTITKTTRLQGEVRVPGELRTAAQALWLAAISEGESRFEYVPPAAAKTLDILEDLGVGVRRDDGTVTVSGVGLRGFSQPQGVVDLDVPVEAALPALATNTTPWRLTSSENSDTSRPRLGRCDGSP